MGGTFDDPGAALPEQFTPLCGWLDIPDRHRVAALFPTLTQAAPSLMAMEPPTGDLLLYGAWKKALGSYVDYPAQQIGDCESFGHGHGNDLLECIETLLDDPTARLNLADIETDTEAAYAAGREAGNMLGGGDGCFGSAMVKGLMTIGLVPRKAVGPYSGQRAKQWGASGMPDEVRKIAAQFKLGAAALVRTWAELLAALASGYPVTVSSSQGFSLQRDADGFCRPQGRWDHCMLICGARQGDNKEGACIFQSWGSNVPSGPLTLDQPPNSFWAPRATVESMLALGDSWSMAKTPYFVARPVPAKWTHNIAA
jgi:hypothetical protein